MLSILVRSYTALKYQSLTDTCSGHKSALMTDSLHDSATETRKAELCSCHSCLGLSFLMSLTLIPFSSRCIFKTSSFVSLSNLPTKIYQEFLVAFSDAEI